MDDFWRPRCNPPRRLVWPLPVDPDGMLGPTPGQARGPRWRRTSPGLYVPSEVDAALVEQRILEAAQRLPEGGAVTGWAALRLHRAGFFDGCTEGGNGIRPVPLLLPPGTDVRRARGVTVRRERILDGDVTSVHGIATTTPLRATFDEIRAQLDLRSAVVVLDMALAARVLTLAELSRRLPGWAGWTGVRQVRAVLPLADPGSLSPQETRVRLVWVLDAGFPPPRCNVAVGDVDGNWVGRPDLLCEELAVVGEYDGAMHRGRDRHRSDVRREDLFRRCGLETFTVVAGDLANTALVVDRMRAAVDRARAANLPRRWTTRR